MKRADITTKQVLIACHSFHSKNDIRAPWEILMDETGAPEKVVYAEMDRDERKGLIECGVSLRLAWVTPKGYEFLKNTL